MSRQEIRGENGKTQSEPRTEGRTVFKSNGKEDDVQKYERISE